MANSRNSRSLFTPNSRNSRSLKRNYKNILQIIKFSLDLEKKTTLLYIFSALMFNMVGE